MTSLRTTCAVFLLAAASHGAAASAAEAPAPAFADGQFFGTLPDPGCAWLDAVLELRADGRYRLHTFCQQDLQAHEWTGTWSVTWNGTCVALAADGVGSPVREFAIHDEALLVLAQGSCIEPVDDPRGRTLRRLRAEA